MNLSRIFLLSSYGNQRHAQTKSMVVIVQATGFIIVNQLEPFELLISPAPFKADFKLDSLFSSSQFDYVVGLNLSHRTNLAKQPLERTIVDIADAAKLRVVCVAAVVETGIE